MTCREFVEFLLDYLEGDLPHEKRLLFESHLRDCPPCETYLDTYRQTVRLGRELLCPPQDELPVDVPSELIDAILAARREGGSQEPPEK